MSKKDIENKTEAIATLPQNVLFIGEHVEEDKNIYISQGVYKEIHRFTKDKTKNESGGVLIGDVVDALGKTNIIISGFIEAKHTEATPTTLKFTHETWEYINSEKDKKFSGKKMLGWIHTHPNFGIFLSEYDKFIHENFFKEDYEVAYVVDPIQHIEGFYFWIDGKLEKCKGFYIYDKTGKKITVDFGSVEEVDNTSTYFGKLQSILILVLLVTTIALGIGNIGMQKRVAQCESKISSLGTTANTNFANMVNAINSLELDKQYLQSRIDELEATINELCNSESGLTEEMETAEIQNSIDDNGQEDQALNQEEY